MMQNIKTLKSVKLCLTFMDKWAVSGQSISEVEYIKLSV